MTRFAAGLLLNPILCAAGFVFSPATPAQNSPEQILLKDYRPRSIYNIPETRVDSGR